MCIFGRRPYQKVHQLDREDAIIAYKVLKLYGGRDLLESPFQHTPWKSAEIRASYLSNTDSGIYAMKSAAGAIANCQGHAGLVLVKVALYGRVFEYGHQQYSSYGGGYRHAGYRAERAEIVEILPPQPVPKTKYMMWARPARPRYGLRPSDMRASIAGLRKRYPKVKFPTYAQIGLK